MGVRLRTPFLLPASHDRARFVHSFLPRDSLGRALAQTRAPRGVPPARRRETRPSARLAPARRTPAAAESDARRERSGRESRRRREGRGREGPNPIPRSRRVRRRGGVCGDAPFRRLRASLRAALASGGDPRREAARQSAHRRRSPAGPVRGEVARRGGFPRAERLPVRVVRARAAACHGGRGAVPRGAGAERRAHLL